MTRMNPNQLLDVQLANVYTQSEIRRAANRRARPVDRSTRNTSRSIKTCGCLMVGVGLDGYGFGSYRPFQKREVTIITKCEVMFPSCSVFAVNNFPFQRFRNFTSELPVSFKNQKRTSWWTLDRWLRKIAGYVRYVRSKSPNILARTALLYSSHLNLFLILRCRSLTSF